MTRLFLASATVAYACAQQPRALPRFEDFPVAEAFKGQSAQPILNSPEERRFRTVITQGVVGGLGVQDGLSGKELAARGPNFAGHYAVVTWGCGSPCLMAAVVDLKTGRVFPPPFHHGPGHSYFQVPWSFPSTPPLSYRLDSRLLIANICESDRTKRIDGRLEYEAQRCGEHYFLITPQGFNLIHRGAEP